MAKFEQDGADPEVPEYAGQFRRSREWPNYLKRNAVGAALCNLSNAIIAFRNCPAFEGVLAWNEFSCRIELTGRPPWLGPHEKFVPHDMQDHEFSRAQQWLQLNELTTINSSATYDAILVAAKDRSHHPVRKYLYTLAWDGMHRIDTWLIDHFGAEDTPLNRAIGARFLLSMIARAMCPGSKVDTMVVLESIQGIGKSKALRELAYPWFTDQMPQDLANKDAALQLQGVWLVEQAELHAVRKTAVDAIKAFLSRSTDRFRPPYGRSPQDFPRQSVMAGTMNPDGNGYLADPTGGRRFWPVACAIGWPKGRRIDIAKLKAVRDQLLAEARFRYEQGEIWWLDDLELEEAQEAAADDRYDPDPWTNRIADIVTTKVSIIMDEVLRGLGIPEKEWTRPIQTRIGMTLTKMKWRNKQEWDAATNRKIRRYYNPNPPKEKHQDNGDNVHDFHAAADAARRKAEAARNTTEESLNGLKELLCPEDGHKT